MSQFSTGVNSMQALRAVIGLAGDNIANVNTPGYHARRAEVAGRPGAPCGGLRIGEGAVVQNVTRLRDVLAERLLLADVQVLERVKQEARILEHVELSFQEPSEESIDAYLGQFFERISGLAADPDDTVLRNQLVQAGNSLSNALNRLSHKLQVIERESSIELERTIGEVNELVARTAELNRRIAAVEQGGVSAPGLKDQRDHAVRKLAELINLRTIDSGNGVVNVSTAGSLLVDGEQHLVLEEKEAEDGVAVSRKGSEVHVLEIKEGKVAGLLRGLNDYLPSFRHQLDEVATALRRRFNEIHTTGLGLNGRFESLRGLNAFYGRSAFSESGYGVRAGTDERLVINVEDKNNGDIVQHELSLDTTLDSDVFLADIASRINSRVGHLNATVQDGRLNLEAEQGYAFGFATPYDPDPAEAGDITAATPASPEVIDAYHGEEDLEYEFTFQNDGQIGADRVDVRIDVHSDGGTLLKTLNRSVGADYQPGEGISIEHGMKFTLTGGLVNAGDSFSFTAHGDMDTAGVLDALGMNTFFNGTGAKSLQVVDAVKQDAAGVAAALRDISGDNHRVQEMESLQSQKLLDGGNSSLLEAYRGLISDVGVARSTRNEHQKSLEGAVTELENEADGTAGVSVDEQMMELLESQRIYQASVKYVKSVDSTLASLLELV